MYTYVVHPLDSSDGTIYLDLKPLGGQLGSVPAKAAKYY